MPRKGHLHSLKLDGHYPEGLGGLSRRVRDLQEALCVGDQHDCGGSNPRGARGGAGRGLRAGSMDMLRSLGSTVQRRGPAGSLRRRSADDDGYVNITCGAGASVKFVESAAYLVSALCGLADAAGALGGDGSDVVVSPKSVADADQQPDTTTTANNPHDLFGPIWEHTRNVDTALCGVGPILDAATSQGGRCRPRMLRKLIRMTQLVDAMARTVRRISDEDVRFGPDVECCYGTQAELLCLTCVEAIRVSCSPPADTAGGGGMLDASFSRQSSRSLFSSSRNLGAERTAAGERQEEEEMDLTWRISDALARSWAAADRRSALDVVYVDDGEGDIAEVKSGVLIEVCLLVLGSLSWAPETVCGAIAKERRGRSALEAARGRKMERGQRRRADLDCAETLARLSETYSSMGEHDLAVQHQEESLRFRRTHLGDDHALVSDTHVSVGDRHAARSDYRAAAASFQEALNSLQTQTESEAGAGSSECDGIPKRGRDVFASMTYNQSIYCIQPAADDGAGPGGACDDDEQNPNRDATIVAVLGKLGRVQAEMGEMDEALSTACECLRLQRSSLGTDHPDVAETLCQRATLYLNGGGDGGGGTAGECAMADFWEALAIRKAHYGPEHRIVSDTLHEMGMVSWGLGQGETALELLSDALWMRQSRADATRDDRLANADTQAVIASIYRKLGRTYDAMTILDDCLRASMEELGDGHEKVADLHVALGHANADARNFNNARMHYSAALVVFEELSDDSFNDKIVQLVYFLSNVELKARNFSAARCHIERYLALKKAAGRGKDDDCARAAKMLVALKHAEKKAEKKTAELKVIDLLRRVSNKDLDEDGLDHGCLKDLESCDRRGSF